LVHSCSASLKACLLGFDFSSSIACFDSTVRIEVETAAVGSCPLIVSFGRICRNGFGLLLD
jgi:hypothetical protein